MDAATRAIIDRFEQINRIPRCSKKEQELSRWLQQWAKDRHLSVKIDSAGNLVIQVPATSGYEEAPTVILQGHMDMVCEKGDDSDHDFDRDPIRMVQEGPWLSATETTLGADNGIAIAMALTLVERPEVSHPPLELCFTVDEETGLTGALALDPSLLKGRTLINLDSEDEGVFVVGCAGGRATTIGRMLESRPIDDTFERLRIVAHGMQGGHSGVDIGKHRANANKVMARLLTAGMTAGDLNLLDLDGGTARNVIPRSCSALVACPRDRLAAVERAVADCAATIREEIRSTEPELVVHLEGRGPAAAGDRAATDVATALTLDLLMALPCGPVEMAPDDPLRVQTSANLATVKMEADALKVVSSQRSAVPSRLDAVCAAVEAVGRLAGARVQTDAGYPSWPVNPASPLLTRCQALYRTLFETDPSVQVMHAGLECGVIGSRCPGMDMISLGPTIENPHSPSERLHVPSVEKVWRLLTALLASFKA